MAHPTLTEMRALVARNDEDGVLRGLLAVWAEHRSPAIAAAIEALSPRFLRRISPPTNSQRWYVAAEPRDSLLVAALLSVPWERERLKVARKKLELLDEFPPDPRIAAFAQRVEQQKGPFGDRARAVLDQVLVRHGSRLKQPPPEALHEQLAEMALSLPPSVEQQLLEAVYASPGDDGPRRVYADYLLSIGEPLAQALTDERHPLRAWWCYQLLGEAGLNGTELRWGFPRKVTWQQGQRPEPTPAWATIEELWALDLAPDHADRLHRMPRLSALHLAYAEGIGSSPALPHLVQLPIERLSLPWLLWRPASMGGAAHWPMLRHLRFLHATAWVRLDEGGLGTIAQRPLSVSLDFLNKDDAHMVSATWRITRRVAPAIRQVWIELFRDKVLSFERDGEGPFDVLRLSGHGLTYVPFLSQALKPILPSDVRRIEVELPAGGREDELREQLKRFPHLEFHAPHR